MKTILREMTANHYFLTLALSICVRHFAKTLIMWAWSGKQKFNAVLQKPLNLNIDHGLDTLIPRHLKNFSALLNKWVTRNIGIVSFPIYKCCTRVLTWPLAVTKEHRKTENCRSIANKIEFWMKLKLKTKQDVAEVPTIPMAHSRRDWVELKRVHHRSWRFHGKTLDSTVWNYLICICCRAPSPTLTSYYSDSMSVLFLCPKEVI